MKLFALLGKGGFDYGLGLEPDFLVRPGDRSDVKDGGVDVGSGIKIIFFDGRYAFGWAEDLEHGVEGGISFLFGFLSEAKGFFFLNGEGKALKRDSACYEF